MFRNTLFMLMATLFMLTRCIPDEVKEKANQQFGDQHFKSAIALIELHKTRQGEYPQSLDSLQYLGDWDKIIFNSVKYRKLEDGYELDLINGWMGKPQALKYPDEFWKGIGLRKSNMKK